MAININLTIEDLLLINPNRHISSLDDKTIKKRIINKASVTRKQIAKVILNQADQLVAQSLYRNN
jgi:hypothetical protein